MLILFRSKAKFRRLSAEFYANKKNYNFNPDSINFHAVSFILWVLVTNLSGRCGRWILYTYSFFFAMTAVFNYYKKHKLYFYCRLAKIKGNIFRRATKWETICRMVITRIDKYEQEFCKFDNIMGTISQIVFFSVCEKILIQEPDVTTSLYSLMFYNVFCYCISYIVQIINFGSRSPYINVANHTRIKHLAMSAMKIILDLTQAIIFLIALILLIFIFCLEQKIDHFKPTKYFTAFTATYYVATEKIFVEFFPSLLSLIRIPYLDDIETLWAPVLLSIIGQILALIFASILICNGAYCGAFVTIYLNVYLSYKKLAKGSLKTLNEEAALISPFRYASEKELNDFEDVCAVCLNEMRIARVTPCHHFFHTDCLRKCLQNSNTCPVCKREMKFC